MGALAKTLCLTAIGFLAACAVNDPYRYNNYSSYSYSRQYYPSGGTYWTTGRTYQQPAYGVPNNGYEYYEYRDNRQDYYPNGVDRDGRGYQWENYQRGEAGRDHDHRHEGRTDRDDGPHNNGHSGTGANGWQHSQHPHVPHSNGSGEHPEAPAFHAQPHHNAPIPRPEPVLMPQHEVPAFRPEPAPVPQHEVPAFRPEPAPMPHHEVPAFRPEPAPMPQHQAPAFRPEPAPMPQHQAPAFRPEPAPMPQHQAPAFRPEPAPMPQHQAPAPSPSVHHPGQHHEHQ